MLITHAPYTTGTVSITAAARTTVTGASTLWNTAVTGFGFNNARIGGKMVFSGLSEIYDVSAVGSDTAITLANRYTGAALSGASYTYFEDEYALAADFARPVDLSMFSTDARIPLIGPIKFRQLVPRNDNRSKPKIATLIQLVFATTTAPRYRVVLSPVPDDEYSIPYWYVTTNLAMSSSGVEQAGLSAAGDEPIVPLRYRYGIVLHALYHWYRDRKDDPRSQEVKAEYTEFMQRAIGDFKTGDDRPRLVVTRQGRASGRRGRFDVGGRWDSLEW